MRQSQSGSTQNNNHITQTAQVVAAEAAALLAVSASLPDNHDKLVQLLSLVTGKIVFIGMGKSGHIARLLAATFSSVGLPSLFLHPSEAVHGDIGALQSNDVCVFISKSGSTDELVLVAQSVRSYGISSALISCDAGALTSLVDIVVQLPFVREACDYNMVPSSSIVVTLAYGHGVALELAAQKGLNPATFSRVHPAGSLGKNLLLTVKHCMISGTALPLVDLHDSFSAILSVITKGCKGVALVVDEHKHLQGLITDGDLRRAAEQGPTVFSHCARDIMTTQPHTIDGAVKAQLALEMMYEKRITSLAVVDDDNAVHGLVHVHDIVASGVTPRSIKEEL